MLHLKPEELDTPEKRRKYRLNVIDCGQRGISYALSFAEAGFKVICTDSDQSVIKQLSKGTVLFGDRQSEVKLKSFLKKGVLKTSGDLKNAISESDVTIVTVNTKFKSKKSSDNTEAVSVCKQVGKAVPKGSLVVYAGMAGLGFVEGIVKETIENTSGFKAGEDFGLAYNPVLSTGWRHIKDVGTQEVTVAAGDKFSLNSAALIFGTIAKGVNKSSNFKVAEVASLFAAAERDTNAALHNELAMFCEKTGVDYVETMKLIGNNGCEKVSSPTISEEANRDQVYLLLENAENLNTQLRLPKVARQLNESMIKYALSITQESLRVGGKTLRRSKIAVLGSAEPETAAASFVRLLEDRGARVSRYDPYTSTNVQPNWGSTKKTLNETAEGADSLIILSDQDQFKRLNLKKVQALMKRPAVLIDLIGIIEPEKVEKNGFIYRGIGRGY